ncbi:MAG: chemotaxis protein CheA [Clostridiaceae bacterium]|nr:chemotaxis protein CheA [Clostridiaceae bacterium]
MSDNTGREPMLEMFIFETFQLVDQLEQSLLDSEKESSFEASINEIFRIMHTIKGSAAMMLYDNISSLAHSIEDLFYYLREKKPSTIDSTKIIDIVLDGADFIKNETTKIQNGLDPDGDEAHLVNMINNYLDSLKSINNDSGKNTKEENESREENEQKYYISSKKTSDKFDSDYYKYEALLFFDDECEMENIRAFSVIHDLEEVADIISYYPEDVMNSENDSDEKIRKDGFKVVFKTNLGISEVKDRLSHTLFLKSLDVYITDDMFQESIKEIPDNSDNNVESDPLLKKQRINIELSETVENAYPKENYDKDKVNEVPESQNIPKKEHVSSGSGKQSVISVNISKLDMLMDLVGELVISEAMVTQNPDLKGLQIDNFYKAARQLNKITKELQDTVMSIRMVPLSMTFQKMNRIVRDMGKKLNKSVVLEIIGEETEVDKNIIERISDPLIHLIRNSIDHGIEEENERVAKGKPPYGKLTLEAKNTGGDVWIIVKDDGRGLDKDKILKRAVENGLAIKPESEYTDKEIYSFIFLPGFSTKEKVTEFSGRGVGMDIVIKNIQTVGGTVQVDSIPGQGTILYIKFPLTLAIIDGMTVAVGKTRYTIPTISIKESFRVKNEAIIQDTEGNELIMLRGECYPVLRLHSFYKIKTEITDINDGIVIMVENDAKTICIFADALLGEQQVVVKALPKYIKKVTGISGCTLLGDGNISLILDIAGLF